MMNLYGFDSSLFDLGFGDTTLIESLSDSHAMIMDRRRMDREAENLLNLSNSVLKISKRESSPPRNRHDGTSPLPLGMDWSTPPRNWDGPNTIWPHDFHTGWSYCVTFPSWSILSESEASDPVVLANLLPSLYHVAQNGLELLGRVQVGLQSPEGVTTTRGVLRRFSDFLKLSSDLKQSFRRKKLPPTPPKGLFRVKSSTVLEERRCLLEDWMAKVLSDIDISRSAEVACFLELEAAARSSFHESSHHAADVNLRCNRENLSDPFSSHSDVSVLAGAVALASNNGNDSPDETIEIDPGLHMENNNYSEFGNGNSDNNLASLTEAAVNGALCENDNAALPKELSGRKEEIYLHKLQTNLDKSKVGALCAVSQQHDEIGHNPGSKSSPMVSHADHFLRESPLKDTSTATPNENSNFWEVHQDSSTSSKCSVSVEASEATDTLLSTELQLPHDKLVVLPTEEEQKMNRLLNTLQQRLLTSKTDIEELIARLNQELAVRQYLATKVKDLETELESTKKSGKENLEQAILIERERFTLLQWDMEELGRKSMEMELRLKAEQDDKAHVEATETSIIKENEALRQELDLAREQLKNLQKCHEEAESKSKTDVKLLVREIKSLRSSQSELRQELDKLAQEKTEFETRLGKERTKREHINAANAKLLNEFEILHTRLEECSVNYLFEHENTLKVDGWSPSDALDILATSENHSGLVLAEAQLLAQDVAIPMTNSSHESDNVMTIDNKLRKMLADVFMDNVILKKEANTIVRRALDVVYMCPDSTQTAKEEDAPSTETVIRRLLGK